MSDVELSGLTKRYGETLAVSDVSLRVEEGEFFSLLDPSGCGKTTTLRMIAGFVRPNEGRIFIGGEDMTLLPPEKRGIGIVFQNYAIFPHMTVFDNIAFGLKMRKIPKREIRGRVGKALDQVNLDGLREALPTRAVRRRAAARGARPRADHRTQDPAAGRAPERAGQEAQGGDEVLDQGAAAVARHHHGLCHPRSGRGAHHVRPDRGDEQGPAWSRSARPTTIYEHPADRFVTDFIGESNILEARVEAVSGHECRIALGRRRVCRAPRRDGIETGQSVGFVVRPERVLIGPAAQAVDGPKVTATVVDRSYQGAIIRYRLQFEGQEIVAEVPNRPDQPDLADGAEAVIGWTVASSELLVD